MTAANDNKGNLTCERLKSLVSYNYQTGQFQHAARGRGKRVGDVVGYSRPDGYICACIDGHTYMAHRLVWLYVHGEWPVGDIDHINGTRNDNRIENLREATRQQNTANQKVQHNNTSGLKGVHRMGHNWQARIQVKGKRVCLGTFTTPEDAGAAYMQAANDYFGEFATDGVRVA